MAIKYIASFVSLTHLQNQGLFYFLFDAVHHFAEMAEKIRDFYSHKYPSSSQVVNPFLKLHISTFLHTFTSILE